MSNEKQITEALLQAEKDSKAELKNSPSAELGCCTISAGGWSEQKPNITKESCYAQKGPGVKITWNPGSC